MKKLFFLLFLIPGISCTKEEVHNWRLEQQMAIFRTTCGVDTFIVTRAEDQKTGDEINALIHEYNYKKWVPKEDLMFIIYYQSVYMPDSVWVESKIIKCGYCANSK